LVFAPRFFPEIATVPEKYPTRLVRRRCANRQVDGYSCRGAIVRFTRVAGHEADSGQ